MWVIEITRADPEVDGEGRLTGFVDVGFAVYDDAAPERRREGIKRMPASRFDRDGVFREIRSEYDEQVSALDLADSLAREIGRKRPLREVAEEEAR